MFRHKFHHKRINDGQAKTKIKTKCIEIRLIKYSKLSQRCIHECEVNYTSMLLLVLSYRYSNYFGLKIKYLKDDFLK